MDKILSISNESLRANIICLTYKCFKLLVSYAKNDASINALINKYLMVEYIPHGYRRAQAVAFAILLQSHIKLPPTLSEDIVQTWLGRGVHIF